MRKPELTLLPAAVICALLCLLIPAIASAEEVSADADGIDEANPVELSVDEISRQLENPLSTLWSLTLQENYTVLEGDALEGRWILFPGLSP